MSDSSWSHLVFSQVGKDGDEEVDLTLDNQLMVQTISMNRSSA